MLSASIKSGLSHAGTNAVLQTEDLPPSTLAAQIVNNLTKSEQQSRHYDQDSFRQLLREILDAENEGNCQSEAIETNITVNYRLIYVVVRAGLEVVLHENPFEHQKVIETQGLNSLAVICSTIRRSPEVLFFLPDDHESNLERSGPLYMWLVPRLLAVFGVGADGSIQASALNTLQMVLRIERKTHLRGVKLCSIQKYIQGCMHG